MQSILYAYHSAAVSPLDGRGCKLRAGVAERMTLLMQNVGWNAVSVNITIVKN